ncbi:MAG TPA: C4-type zinc ribbon domain-containing protein [Anaerolineae bacterium]
MSRIATLWHLQTIDQELDDKIKRARQIDAALANDPQTSDARAASEAAQHKASAARVSLRAQEMDAKDLDGKIKQVEERLYGGRVSNPKELGDLEKDVQMHKRRRSEMDDALLALMETAERAAGHAFEETAALEKTEAARAGEIAQLEREQSTINRRTEELGEQRDQARALLDADVQRQYDQLRRTKAGRAVAQAKNDSCGVCGVTIPTGLLNRVHTGDEIVLCTSCGRMLA